MNNGNGNQGGGQRGNPPPPANPFNDAQFTTWMQTITRAMTQQVANPNNRILNIAKLPDYHGNDTEDPFEWIDTAKTTARANNWNEAKLLQIAPSAMKGTAQQWYTSLQTTDVPIGAYSSDP